MFLHRAFGRNITVVPSVALSTYNPREQPIFNPCCPVYNSTRVLHALPAHKPINLLAVQNKVISRPPPFYHPASCCTVKLCHHDGILFYLTSMILGLWATLLMSWTNSASTDLNLCSRQNARNQFSDEIWRHTRVVRVTSLSEKSSQYINTKGEPTPNTPSNTARTTTR